MSRKGQEYLNHHVSILILVDNKLFCLLRSSSLITIVEAIFLGLGVSTVESNRDRDVSTRPDVVFQTVEKIWTVKMSFFQTVEIETLDRNLDKNQEILIFRVIETVETWFLNCRYVGFQTVEKISTVEISRSRLSIEIRSKQIETPNPYIFYFCRLLYTIDPSTSVKKHQKLANFIQHY
jgi:hypothetical protein